MAEGVSKVQKESDKFRQILTDFGESLIEETNKLEEEHPEYDVNAEGLFEGWCTKLIVELAKKGLVNTHVRFLDNSVQPQETDAYDSVSPLKHFRQCMGGMTEEFIQVVGQIDAENAQNLAMLRAEKASIERSIAEHERKARMKPESAMNRAISGNGFQADFSGIAKIQIKRGEKLDILMQDLEGRVESTQQTQKMLMDSVTETMEKLIENLIKGEVQVKIVVADLIERGNIQYNRNDLLDFPCQPTFEKLCSENKLRDFRLVGMSRPNDSSKNRWNFIFSNDVKTDTNLQETCTNYMLEQGGKNISKIDIFQTGDAPLYGFTFYFEDNSQQKIGNTSGSGTRTINLAKGDRIVGIRFKDNKHMYRYGFRFLIQSDKT